MTVNDRLYDELLKPVADDYYETAKKLAEFLSVPFFRDSAKALALQERLAVLRECGDRIARVIEVAEPLWADMAGMAGLEVAP